MDNGGWSDRDSANFTYQRAQNLGKECNELEAKNEKLKARIEKALAGHVDVRLAGYEHDSCESCTAERWPCPTYRILHGEVGN